MIKLTFGVKIIDDQNVVRRVKCQDDFPADKRVRKPLHIRAIVMLCEYNDRHSDCDLNGHRDFLAPIPADKRVLGNQVLETLHNLCRLGLLTKD